MARVKYAKIISESNIITYENQDISIMPPKIDNMEWAKIISSCGSVRPVEATKQNENDERSCIVPHCNRVAKFDSIVGKFSGGFCSMHHMRVLSRLKFGVPINDLADLNFTTRKIMQDAQKMRKKAKAA